jgi:hypothetical protein
MKHILSGTVVDNPPAHFLVESKYSGWCQKIEFYYTIDERVVTDSL